MVYMLLFFVLRFGIVRFLFCQGYFSANIAILKKMGKQVTWIITRRVPFYWHCLTLIPAWRVNYIHYEIWAEITYPLPYIKSETAEIWEIYPILYWKRDFLSILGLTLNHINKTDPWSWRIY